MKSINDFKAWKDGQEYFCNVLTMHVNSDNLKDQCTFFYSLNIADESGSIKKIIDGNLTMSGVDYDEFIDNEKPYNYAAKVLGVDIVGEYVPPQPQPQPEK